MYKIALTLLSIISLTMFSSVKLVGEIKVLPASEHTLTSQNVIGNLQLDLADNSTLVGYGQQVVAGMNHFMVHQSSDKYSCTIVYERSWENSISITLHQKGLGEQEAFELCKVHRIPARVLLKKSNLMMAGGIFVQDLDDDNKTRTQDLIVDLNLRFGESDKKELVGYGTQVVSGINHFMVHKLNQDKFSCTIVYHRAWDNYKTVSKHQTNLNEKDAFKLCNLQMEKKTIDSGLDGGISRNRITEETRKEVNEFMNYHNLLSEQDSELIAYASQNVAGMNHFIVHKVGSVYYCTELYYVSWLNKKELIKHDSFADEGAAKDACNINDVSIIRD